eukprot:8455075-Pyramimonas_sp.AAC.1
MASPGKGVEHVNSLATSKTPLRLSLRRHDVARELHEVVIAQIVFLQSRRDPYDGSWVCACSNFGTKDFVPSDRKRAAVAAAEETKVGVGLGDGGATAAEQHLGFDITR